MNAPRRVSQTVASTPVIVLLAAGEGRRFGGLKQLADIDGLPMLRHTALALLTCDVPLIVVTGASADVVEVALNALPVTIVRHASWQDGMGSSLAAGMREVQTRFPEASGALLCLADQPLLDAATLSPMLTRHRAAPDRILATEHAGVAGPPVLFPRDCFATLATWSGHQGAHALLQREAARVERFASRGGIDVDTLEDLQQVRALLAAGSPVTAKI